ncbi:MAG: UDP-N-acetylmuramoyl-L-alanine--D-glutamate ligase [Phycisphaerae bacterium]|nr:UDP-N-acetylmuramoyl-L-alanine--D-glutamate ligase [Phycisphaerae bacterium]
MANTFQDNQVCIESRDCFDGRNVLVMGLGRFGGGVGVSRFLCGCGARVTVTDMAKAEDLRDSVVALDGLDIEFHLGGHREADFKSADLIIVNPAVKRSSEWLKVARDHGVPLTSEMNIFFSLCAAPIVGVTGSNGKSTTTAMIYEMMKAAGSESRPKRRAWMGGNIGRENLLERLGEIDANDLVVIELSSFQLESLAEIQRSPHIAVVTNIAPNHLDWHGTMEEYVSAKQNILRYQGVGDTAVLNRLNGGLKDWNEVGGGEVLWYPDSVSDSTAGGYDLPLQVPGRHNQVNALAAMAVGSVLGIDVSIGRVALCDFKGLEHRLEFVREVDGVRYFNDSIATTPESAIAAIQAFDMPKVMILGGYDKGVSFGELAEVVAREVDVAICIGQVADVLVELIEESKRKINNDNMLCLKAADFEAAVLLASEHSRPGGVVLMSPACASYDMFTNFQERGERFRAIVGTLG